MRGLVHFGQTRQRHQSRRWRVRRAIRLTLLPSTLREALLPGDSQGEGTSA